MKAKHVLPGPVTIHSARWLLLLMTVLSCTMSLARAQEAEESGVSPSTEAALAAQPQDEAVGQVAEAADPAILGIWKAVRGTSGDLAMDDFDLEPLVFTFGKGEAVIEGNFGYGSRSICKYTVDPKAEPMTIDIMPDRQDAPAVKGIYKLEDEQLVVCLAKSGKASRPEAFEANKENGFVLLWFQRRQ
jgi:uncharacterized protein (TIGR03067 family)